MKLQHFRTVLCATVLLASCGPQVESSSSDGAEGEGGDVPAEQQASWALGFFHDPDLIGPGSRASYVRMYEIREDGTGELFVEGCVEGVMGPYEEFSWRGLDENTIELFDPDGGEVDWIRGNRETIVLSRVEDGRVSQSLDSDSAEEYVRGKLCVVERVPSEQCLDPGFVIGVCDE